MHTSQQLAQDYTHTVGGTVRDCRKSDTSSAMQMVLFCFNYYVQVISVNSR